MATNDWKDAAMSRRQRSYSGRVIAQTYDLGTLDRTPIEQVRKVIYELQAADEAILKRLSGAEEDTDQVSEDVWHLHLRLEKLEASVVTREVLDELDELEERIQELEQKPIRAILEFETRLVSYTQRCVRLNALHKEAVQNAVDAVQTSRLDILKNPPGGHDAILGVVMFEIIVSLIPYSLVFKTAMRVFAGLAKRLGAKLYGSQKNFLLALDAPRRKLLNEIKQQRKQLSKVSVTKRKELRQAWLETLDKETSRISSQTKRVRQRRSQIIRHHAGRDSKRRDEKIEKMKNELLKDYRTRLNDMLNQESQHKKKLDALRKQAKHLSEKDTVTAKKLTQAAQPIALDINKRMTGNFTAEWEEVIDPAKLVDKGFEEFFKRAPQLVRGQSREEPNPPRLKASMDTGDHNTQSSEPDQTAISGDSSQPAQPEPRYSEPKQSSHEETSTSYHNPAKLPLDVALKIFVQGFWDDYVKVCQEETEVCQDLRAAAEAAPAYAWDALAALTEIFGEDYEILDYFADFDIDRKQQGKNRRDNEWSLADELQLRHELTAHYEFIIWSILLVNEFELRAYTTGKLEINESESAEEEYLRYTPPKEITLEEYENGLNMGEKGIFLIAVSKGTRKPSEEARDVTANDPTLPLDPVAAGLNSALIQRTDTFRYIWERFGNNKYNPTIEVLAWRMQKCAAKYGELVASVSEVHQEPN